MELERRVGLEKAFQTQGPACPKAPRWKEQGGTEEWEKAIAVRAEVKGSELQHSRGPGGSDHRLFMRHEAARRRGWLLRGLGALF